MHPQMVFDLRQKPRRFVTRRLDHVALELRQSACPQLAPGVLLAGRCRMLQEDIVAHRLDGHQAQTAGEGFILRDRAIPAVAGLEPSMGFPHACMPPWLLPHAG